MHHLKPVFFAAILGVSNAATAMDLPACSHPTLYRMIDFLEKEKVRLIHLEKQTLAQVKKRPDLLQPEEIGLVKSQEKDLRTQAARARRSVNAQTPSTQDSELPNEILDFREYVLNRVQGFPYRKESSSFEEPAPPTSTLGRLQLFRDQYSEVDRWQHEFAGRCARISASPRLAGGT